jgi:hypothetical protein
VFQSPDEHDLGPWLSLCQDWNASHVFQSPDERDLWPWLSLRQDWNASRPFDVFRSPCEHDLWQDQLRVLGEPIGSFVIFGRIVTFSRARSSLRRRSSWSAIWFFFWTLVATICLSASVAAAIASDLACFISAGVRRVTFAKRVFVGCRLVTAARLGRGSDMS